MGSHAGNPSLVNHTRSRPLLLAYPFCSGTRNSLSEMCIGIICSCMTSLSSMLRHHSFHFATFQSLFSSHFKYFSDRCTCNLPSAEPEVLTPYKGKVKRVHSELETGMSEYCGSEDSSLEVLQRYGGVEDRGSWVLQQYEVASLDTSNFRKFVSEEDRIQMRMEVTVIRQ